MQNIIYTQNKPQFEELKKHIDQVRVYIQDQVDDMIKRDENVTVELTNQMKLMEKALQDKISLSFRNTNDAQTKNQEQFTAMQKLVDKLRTTQQDRASEIDSVNKKLRLLAGETDGIRSLHSMQMEAGQKIEILEGKVQEHKLSINNIIKFMSS